MTEFQETKDTLIPYARNTHRTRLFEDDPTENFFKTLDPDTKPEEFEAKLQKLRKLDEDYPKSFKYLVNEWTRLTGVPAKSDKRLIRMVNDLEEGEAVELTHSQQLIYEQLLGYGVHKVFDIASSHRHWIKLVYKFLKEIGVQFPEGMATAIRNHDLSKFTFPEGLGYGVMFGETGEYRTLTGAEKTEWDATLDEHRGSNPHHPEFFSGYHPVIRQPGKDLYFLESIIDMLAARGERVIAKDKKLSILKWFDMPGEFLSRYNPNKGWSRYNQPGGDKEMVRTKLSEWYELAKIYDNGNSHFHDGDLYLEPNEFWFDNVVIKMRPWQ